MGICCVDGCEPDANEELFYFPVPVAAALRRKWQTAIGSGLSSRLHQDSRICSRHFAASDYEEVRGKRRLKARVVPSLFFFDSNNVKRVLNPLASRAKRKQLKQRLAGERETHGACERDGDSARLEQHGQDVVSCPDFGLLRADGDACAECTTIECVPEAILNHDTDSHSETELPKEDIEDIIANYHIQQRRALEQTETAHRGGKEIDNHKKKRRHRTRNTDTNGTGGKETDEEDNDVGDDIKEKEETSETESAKTDDPAETARGRETERVRDKDGDTIEIPADPGDRPPEFIEISVDAARKGRSTGAQDDCLLVLEKVQVDIDPATLMLPDNEDSDRREAAISLVTSSDDSDVILEEPHIDTVEVSSETDEDDKPLVALVKKKQKPNKLTRLLWGNLTEYYCYQCKFTTLSKTESEKHKLQHSKILMVCEVCDYTCGHSNQMTRHKKKHREEKRYKCRYCDYRARHNMSLVYHMKSHEGATIEAPSVVTVPGKYRCSECRFVGSSRKSMMRHVRTCKPEKPKPTTHKCAKCAYSTKRRNDLKRHIERKHADADDNTED